MSFKLGDSRYHDKDALLQKIANEPMVLQYQTRTDLALIMARDEMFTEAGGDRPDKPNVMIVLTDGKPTHPKKVFDFANIISEDFMASVKSRFRLSIKCYSTFNVVCCILTNFMRQFRVEV